MLSTDQKSSQLKLEGISQIIFQSTKILVLTNEFKVDKQGRNKAEIAKKGGDEQF